MIKFALVFPFAKQPLILQREYSLIFMFPLDDIGLERRRNYPIHQKSNQGSPIHPI